MFGFRGGVSPDVVTRKGGYMAEVQVRGPFPTHLDASTIKNDRQLVTMLKERCSLTQEADVRQWMEGKVL